MLLVVLSFLFAPSLAMVALGGSLLLSVGLAMCVLS